MASPPALKPYLRFQKLPNAALGPVRRAVDSDDEFRKRIASVVIDESLAGRVGWLWLHRPDGWRDEVGDLLTAEQADETAAAEQRRERSAAKRLDAAEATVRRVSAELAAMRAELTAERQRRLEVETLRTRLERKVAQLEVELGGARRRGAQAEDARAAAEADAAAAAERAGDADARIAVVEAQRAEADARTRVAEAALEVALRGAEAPSPGMTRTAPAALPGDSDALVEALREAASATQRLGEALAAAAAAVGPDTVDDCPSELTSAGPAPAPGRRRRPRRTPLPLPGGVLADTAEAATHLVRQPGVLLVVDGYNAAKLGWPDETLPIQRERLLDALDELVTRHGTAVHVVFDGADRRDAPHGRRRLRVEFSPAGVPADDVIVELVATLPVDRPVVVATNDGEVRAGARARGANVISSQQLLAVARR